MSRAEPETRIGHVHLKVANLDKMADFYAKVLGLEVMQRYGDQAVFMSAGGYHHHLGLNTWHSKNGPRPGSNATGLYHTAFLFPDRPALARAVLRARDAGVHIYGAADHGVSEALYFDDPEGNGVEIYRDRDPSDWPRDAEGILTMVNEPLDVDTLLAEA